MDATMKAVVVRAPMQFEVEEVPTPACPEGGMLIQVIACGLCGSDLRTLRVGHRKVTFPWRWRHLNAPWSWLIQKATSVSLWTKAMRCDC